MIVSTLILLILLLAKSGIKVGFYGTLIRVESLPDLLLVTVVLLHNYNNYLSLSKVNLLLHNYNNYLSLSKVNLLLHNYNNYLSLSKVNLLLHNYNNYLSLSKVNLLLHNSSYFYWGFQM